MRCLLFLAGLSVGLSLITSNAYAQSESQSTVYCVPVIPKAEFGKIVELKVKDIIQAEYGKDATVKKFKVKLKAVNPASDVFETRDLPIGEIEPGFRLEAQDAKFEIEFGSMMSEQCDATISINYVIDATLAGSLFADNKDRRIKDKQTLTATATGRHSLKAKW